MMNVKMMLNGLAALSLLWLTGCNNKPGDTATVEVSPVLAKYLLAQEPAGAKHVTEAREHVQDKDEVVVVGRIGGEVNPWVEGLAAFKIADLSRKACNDKPGDDCPTPWDFCCEKDMPQSVALVQLVDEHGKTLAVDAKKSLGLKELQTIVVQGTAEQDDKHNLIVNAKKVFIRK